MKMEDRGRLFFVKSQRRREFRHYDRKQKGSSNMTDAQVGLALATPIIVAFAIALRKMGVLQGYSAMAAVLFSVAIAAVLFLQQ